MATVTLPTPGAYPGAVPVIVAGPMNTPVTNGFGLAIACPAGMNTDAGTVAMAGLLLVSVTVRPPAGASVASVTGNWAWAPGATVTLPTVMTLTVTVTSTDALVKPGAVALMFVLPIATPVTENVAVVWPCGTSTEGTTVAMPGAIARQLHQRPTGRRRLRQRDRSAGDATDRNERRLQRQ
jgi:hypothetical protein